MNRPRNRQQRPPRQQNGPPKNDRSRPARPYAASVPNVQQVVPGASVSIVLKEDQPTGKENQGIVQDLLTRGNHPRGIKVRLTDGRVGRVQRMAGNDSSVSQTQTSSAAATTNYRREGTRLPSVRDVRNEEDTSGPPPRTLFDFLPPELNDDNSTEMQHPSGNVKAATATCPFCSFEGNEVAVSRHVDEHLT